MPTIAVRGKNDEAPLPEGRGASRRKIAVTRSGNYRYIVLTLLQLVFSLLTGASTVTVTRLQAPVP